MSSGDLIVTERSLALVSGGTGGVADGTSVHLEWTFHFLGSRAGHYKAAPLKVTVRPSHPETVTGIILRIVERFLYSGMIAKQEEFRMRRADSVFEVDFEWDSTVNNPHQELSVQLDTTMADAPTILLADPISRRRDFLISLSSQS